MAINTKRENLQQDDNHVLIFDTTLRDGEQSPGATLNMDEKIRIAHQLAKLKVDIIEAGFPASSPGDFEAVKRIASEVKGPCIAGLCRAMTSDIDAVWDAVKYADKPRIHTFIATSDIHIETKFKKTRDEIRQIAATMVAYARDKFGDRPINVEFSAEDAGRTEPAYLYSVLEAVIDAGATTVNIPDTVGYTLPEEFGRLIKGIKDNVKNIDQAIIATHCHNDLGLAVANSLAGIMNGARQIECTINGIGERAGNAAMEELVMAMRVRKDMMNGNYTTIYTPAFYETSQMVSELTHMPIQYNKAIIGRNAFAHESGIHQDGMLKGRETYEIMHPEDIGLTGSQLPLGPRSGKNAVRSKLEALGYQLTDLEMAGFFNEFKKLADATKRVADNDLAKLYEQFQNQVNIA